MKKLIEKLKLPANERGMSLIEILIALGIIITVATLVSYSIASGLNKLQNLNIQRRAGECARIVMEYFSTVSPDVVYGKSPQVQLESDFAGAGIMELNAFVNSTTNTCKPLSDPGTAIGQKVQMKYAICPGCVSYTYTDPLDPGLPAWTACEYTLKVRVTYNGLTMGGKRKIEYNKKLYEGKRYGCVVDPLMDVGVTVCGSTAGGEAVKSCNWTN